MTSTEILGRLHDLGVSVLLNGSKVRLEPGSKVPADLLDEVRRNKAEIMLLLSSPVETSIAWPPPDAEELIAKWKSLGCPKIPVALGLSVSDLHRWFYPGIPGERPVEHVAAIRGFLLEGLDPSDVPTSDPLLEELFRTALPFWKKRLAEGEAAKDARIIHQAKWMVELFEVEEGLA